MLNSSQTSSLPSLPDDLIIEVLLRLPVKSLVRFRCVCKFFQYLITSNHFFARSHLQISLNNTSKNKNNGNPGGSKNVLVLNPRDLNPKTRAIVDPDPLGKRISMELARASADSSTCRLILAEDNFHLAGCYDGIICFYGLRYSCNVLGTNLIIYLCNPALNQCRVLPKSKVGTQRRIRYYKPNTKVCFLFDPVSADYKVIIITDSMKPLFKVEIYSLSKNSWRGITWDVPSPSYLILRSDPVVHNGFPYWITQRSDIMKHNVLNVLDMTQEKIGEILLPDCLRTMSYAHLLRYKGSLAISSRIHVIVELWVMKEDNKRISWVKQLVNMDPPCVCRRLSYVCHCYVWSYFCRTPLATTSWTYLIAYGENIFLGDAENGRAEKCTVQSKEDLSLFFKYVAADYVASLVSVMPPRQPILRSLMQSQNLDDEEKKHNVLSGTGGEKEDKTIDPKILDATDLGKKVDEILDSKQKKDAILEAREKEDKILDGDGGRKEDKTRQRKASCSRHFIFLLRMVKCLR